MVNTTLIIEVIAIIFLIGILAYIAVVMFSRPKPDGPPGKNCWAGTKYNAAYTDNGASGCISTPETPVSESECKNGIWMSSTADGSKGYCVCNKSFFGKNCDKECGSDVPCKNGQSCQNGKCVGGKSCDCKKQGFDASKYTCGSGSDKCNMCTEDWGPGFPSCNMKKYKELTLATRHCHQTGDSDDEWDTICKQDYPGSSYVGPVCSSSQSGCFFSHFNRVGVCKIPVAYAFPGFDNYANLNGCDPGKLNQFNANGGFVPS